MGEPERKREEGVGGEKPGKDKGARKKKAGERSGRAPCGGGETAKSRRADAQSRIPEAFVNTRASFSREIVKGFEKCLCLWRRCEEGAAVATEKG